MKNLSQDTRSVNFSNKEMIVTQYLHSDIVSNWCHSVGFKDMSCGSNPAHVWRGEIHPCHYIPSKNILERTGCSNKYHKEYKDGSILEIWINDNEQTVVLLNVLP